MSSCLAQPVVHLLLSIGLFRFVHLVIIIVLIHFSSFHVGFIARNVVISFIFFRNFLITQPPTHTSLTPHIAFTNTDRIFVFEFHEFYRCPSEGNANKVKDLIID